MLYTQLKGEGTMDLISILVIIVGLSSTALILIGLIGISIGLYKNPKK
jgi:uncharacterized membrane protein